MRTRTDYEKAVDHNLKGLTAVSTGPCPGCQDCADAYGFDTLEEYDEAYEAGEVCAEGGFSWSACDICGSSLGGDREQWHAIDHEGKLIHGDSACVDCVLYLANGDVPEQWEG